jgi:hypothetical protein
LRARVLLLDLDHVTDDLEVGGGNLAAPIDQVELQLLTFSETLETRTLDLANVDEHVLTALIALDEAEAFLGVEELDLALAGPDDLRRHAAAARAARGTVAASEPAAIPAALAVAAEAVAAAEAVTAASATPVVTAETRRAAIRKRIETLLPETVPLVAPPAATTFIVTHEPNVPSLRSFPPVGSTNPAGAATGAR